VDPNVSVQFRVTSWAYEKIARPNFWSN
jgi:hypothetical protein